MILVDYMFQNTFFKCIPNLEYDLIFFFYPMQDYSTGCLTCLQLETSPPCSRILHPGQSSKVERCINEKFKMSFPCTT